MKTIEELNKKDSIIEIVQRKDLTDLEKSKKVEEMIESGKADKQEKNDCNSTALHYAAAQGDIKTVEILIKLGADVNTVNELGATALMNAINRCRDNRTEVIKMLLENGANTNIKDIHNDATIHMAAEKNDLEIVQLIAQHSPNDLKLLNGDGGTIMHSAAYGMTRKYNFELIKWLINDKKLGYNGFDNAGHSVVDIMNNNDAHSAAHEYETVILGIKWSFYDNIS